MKCVKYGGLVVRVPNEIAADLVGRGWAYADKAAWKRGGRLGPDEAEAFFLVVREADAVRRSA